MMRVDNKDISVSSAGLYVSYRITEMNPTDGCLRLIKDVCFIITFPIKLWNMTISGGIMHIYRSLFYCYVLNMYVNVLAECGGNLILL